MLCLLAHNLAATPCDYYMASDVTTKQSYFIIISQQSLKISRKHFIASALLSKYFIPYFKVTPKKWTVTCNVRCSVSLNNLSQNPF